MRIPRADSGRNHKDFYDGFSIVPVFSATDYDALKRGTSANGAADKNDEL